MLQYLQDNFNLSYDIRQKIMDELKLMDIIKIDTCNNKRKYKEVIKCVEYYSYLNVMINKRKHKTYNILNTIKHFDIH